MAIPTSYPPPAPPLANYFTIPTTDQASNNPDFWNAYKAEQAHVFTDCPSATGIPSWYVYHAVVLASLAPVAPWNAGGVGTNQAILDASSWEWDSNPKSGRNTVYPS